MLAFILFIGGFELSNYEADEILPRSTADILVILIALGPSGSPSARWDWTIVDNSESVRLEKAEAPIGKRDSRYLVCSPNLPNMWPQVKFRSLRCEAMENPVEEIRYAVPLLLKFHGNFPRLWFGSVQIHRICEFRFVSQKLEKQLTAKIRPPANDMLPRPLQ